MDGIHVGANKTQLKSMSGSISGYLDWQMIEWPSPMFSLIGSVEYMIKEELNG